MNFKNEFVDQSILRLKENTPKIEICLQQLSEQEIWLKPNSASNSIGNLILHLCGNITQYILSSLGEQEDFRNRNQEFIADGILTKSELMEKLRSVLKESIELLRQLADEKLIKNHSVQGFDLSGIGIIIHVVEHYSYHTGQIAFYTKLLKNDDLKFHTDIDLDVKNKLK